MRKEARLKAEEEARLNAEAEAAAAEETPAISGESSLTEGTAVSEAQKGQRTATNATKEFTTSKGVSLGTFAAYTHNQPKELAPVFGNTFTATRELTLRWKSGASGALRSELRLEKLSAFTQLYTMKNGEQVVALAFFKCPKKKFVALW